MNYITNKIKNRISFFDIGFPLIALLIFIFLPILITFLNPDDAELTTLEILLMGIVISVIINLFYFGIQFIIRIPEAIKKILTSLSLLLFIIILFLPTSSGLIDGLKKDTTFNFKMILDFFKYVIIFSVILIFIFNKKIIKYIKSLSLAIFIIAILIIGYITIAGENSNEIIRKKLWDNFKSDMIDDSAFEEFATDKNIIIILWDGLQGRIAEQVFADSKESLKKYDGFTFFPNAIGNAPLTARVLPILYSGKSKMYYTQKYDVIINTIYKDSFFIDAKKNGYKVAAKGVRPFLAIGGFKNYEDYQKLKTIKKGTYLGRYFFFLYASQKRITPLILQRIIIPWANFFRKIKENPEINPIGSKKINITNEMENYFHIERFRLGDFKKKLVYFHPGMGHEPYYDQKGNGGYSIEKAKYVFSCALLNVNTSIFNKLKELEIYDSSLILVISDHGCRVPETCESIKAGNSGFYLSYTGISSYPVSAYNPLIMIKKPYSKGLMKISNNPAISTDLRSLISAYMKGEELKKETIFNLDNVKERDFKLILTIDPKIGRSLGTHSFIDIKGNLNTIPTYFQPQNYIKTNN